jgi:hypothetical protein
MSTIAIPSSLQASDFTMTLLSVQRTHSSPYAGSEQVIDLLNDRWTVSVQLAPMVGAEGGALDGFIAALRGSTNTVNLWHMARPAPLGTMRGSPTVNGVHAIGAATLNVTTTAGATVKQGDLIGANGLLLMAAADATADGSGAIAIPLANRLRKAMAGGEAVTWDKPTAPFRKVTVVGISYSGGIANGVSLDFVEAIS